MNKDNISFLSGFTIIGVVITIIIAIVALTTIAIVSYHLITDSTTSSSAEIQTDENSNNSKKSNNNKTSSNSAESSNSDNTDENQTNTSSNLRFFANYIGGIAQNIKNNTAPGQIDEVNNISLSKIKIVAGTYFSCENTSDDQAYCWGYNKFGQLGNNSTTNSSVPVAVVGATGVLSGKTVKAISTSNGHTCVIASDDQAYCWGANNYGQLGNNSTNTSLVPVAVDTSGVLNGKTVKAISTSNGHTCVIASDNQAYCWGDNEYGEFGNNSTNTSLVPVAVDTSGVLSGKTIESISAGAYHTCAIASDDRAYCWGGNDHGQLGNNSTDTSLVPVAVDTSGVLSGKTIKSISTGYGHTCVIASDNQAYCWGENWIGQLGNNSTDTSLVPVAVDTSGVLSGKTIKLISAGGSHTCVIASDNQAYCWGYNSDGELGNNSTTDSSIPVAVDTSGVLSGKTIKSVSTGEDHTCVIASDNQAYCWGYNRFGQLGNNSTTNSSVPAAVNASGVLSGKTIKSLSAGVEHTCVIASDNQTYCWGYNGDGQLGNNSTTDSTIPVAVRTSGVLSGKTIKSISTGGAHTCAIASDDQVYCWGDNEYGQLGISMFDYSSVPVAVDTSGILSGKTIKSISAGSGHTCVIASDDQAYCWGWNGSGQLGNNSISSYSSVPVAVDTSGVLSGKTIKSIVAESYHTCAIASDNQAYCWGGNSIGELGNNSTTDSTIPVAVDTSGVLSDKTVKAISTSGHTCVIASDDQAYCWGWNGSGQLGNNSTTDSSVPVAVSTSGVLSGKTIKSISTGYGHTCVIASDNQAYCWGGNSIGELGNNSTTDSTIPVAVDTSGVLSGKKIKSIGLGYNHTCIITLDEQTYCWGGNDYGQLGNNSKIGSLVPVQVISHSF